MRRLAGITQVVSASEGHIFHNRLTHVLKVAQIGRGIAEHLLHSKRNRTLADLLGGLDPDVVEAASFAHDLGHPPFGHMAEKVLDELCQKHGLQDGFEGNAQSFHIVTKLAIRTSDQEGLNLTRATLAALLKYPWARTTDTGKKSHKWGFYHCDSDDYQFARAFLPDATSDRKTLEAEIMDWADDIAYSVYDLEDFFRAGKIPLHRLACVTANTGPGKTILSSEATDFLARAVDRWSQQESLTKRQIDQYRRVLLQLGAIFPFSGPFVGDRQDRGLCRNMTSSLVRRYLIAITLNPAAVKRPDAPRVLIDEQMRREVKLLKEFTWQYIICASSLAHQQQGQRQVITTLFNCFMEAADKEEFGMFPAHLQDALRNTEAGVGGKTQRVRLVADFIASLGEQQSIELYQRLAGLSLGSVMRSIV